MGYLRHPAVECRVETGHLRQVRIKLVNRLQPLNFRGQVIRGQRYQEFQTLDQCGGHQLGLNVVGTAVDDAVSYAMQVLAHFMAFKPFKESFPGGIMIREVQFPGYQPIAFLINGMKEALGHPDSFQCS